MLMMGIISKYKHISFDLDGTLVHTIPEYRYRVVPETIKQAGGQRSQSRCAIDRFWFEAGRDERFNFTYRMIEYGRRYQPA